MSSQFVGTSFPANASYGDTYFDMKNNLLYRFIGSNSLDSLHWIIFDGSVSVDPDTTGWGDRQRGAKWFNYTDVQWKCWNGIEIVLMG